MSTRLPCPIPERGRFGVPVQAIDRTSNDELGDQELESAGIPSTNSVAFKVLGYVAVAAPLKRFKRGTGVTTGSSAYYDDCDMALQGPIDSLEVVVALSEPRNSAQFENLNLPPCCSLSLVNNEFIAYDLEERTVIAICGDDGEVNELGFGLDELYSRYAELWASQLEG